MSILSGLKNKIIGRKDTDFGELRDDVLNENKFGTDEGPESPRLRRQPAGAFEDKPFDPLNPEPVDSFGPPPGRFREPVELPRAEERNNYDVMEKLSFIEAQLSAIRSQTELINERLKNLEARLGTRRW